jgi:hypothetical protein
MVHEFIKFAKNDQNQAAEYINIADQAISPRKFLSYEDILTSLDFDKFEYFGLYIHNLIACVLVWSVLNNQEVKTLIVEDVYIIPGTDNEKVLDLIIGFAKKFGTNYSYKKLEIFATPHTVDYYIKRSFVRDVEHGMTSRVEPNLHPLVYIDL